MTDNSTLQGRDRRRDPGRGLAIPHAIGRGFLTALVTAIYVIFVAPFGPVRPALRRTLQRGRGVYRTVLDFQTRLLLTLVYGLVMIPMGLGMRLFKSSPLNQPREAPGSFWSPYKAEPPTIDRYRRMF